MTSYNKQFEKEWQDLIYTVDVIVTSVQNKIVAYK